MTRYFLQCSFLGKGFHGSQIQNNSNLRTVQSELERAFKIYLREDSVKITLSSRVDTGVNARCMTGHVDLEISSFDEQHFIRHINGILQNDISLEVFKPVAEDFHARYHAKSRTYIYNLRANTAQSALNRHITAYYPYNLDVDKLNEITSILIGKYNCLGLSREYNNDKISPLCTITEAFWQDVNGLIQFRITANHFLYKMVRNIVGTSIDIARGYLPVDNLAKALYTQDRDYLGHTAKPKGLTLENIEY